jgi:hypothetical protein
LVFYYRIKTTKTKTIIKIASFCLYKLNPTDKSEFRFRGEVFGRLRQQLLTAVACGAMMLWLGLGAGGKKRV